MGLCTGSVSPPEVTVDARYLAMLGYGVGEIQIDLQSWRQILHPEDRDRVQTLAEQVTNGDLDRFDAEYRMRHRDGHWVWIQDRSRVFERDADGKAMRVAGTHIDITRRKVAELKLEYLVDHDELTGLLNRRGIWQSVQRIHARGRRSGLACCLAILDLDHFKLVNDAYGHGVGDEVSKPVSFLRLDVNLVRLANESVRARSILAAIQHSAKDLGITTIAKQIEDEGTLQRLVDLGVEWGSWYLFGRPSEPS
ncbi:MAG: PAS domain-containing protein [Thiocapsa sp. C3-sup]|uniref:bifunctional diguanylate cyclase/phosphodiesterase n=1 Tax=unclassified Thiocapsa TaxID=2641286 RepID=UPI0035B3AE0D